MTITDITLYRLINQHLLGNQFKSPHEAVSHLGAVQSQDYFAASWSLGQRVENATVATIDQAFNEGQILRTHIMRPTWHFVAPEDIRWIQKLTSSQVKKLMGHYNRKLELDDALFKKSTAAIVKILKEKRHATRQELKAELTKIGIHTDVQRLAHIVMWAELDAVIVSGPRIGKQFTYALLDERAPKAKTFTREDALSELAKRYFTSHGPAQVKDFAWWSGLAMKDAQEGISMVKSQFEEQTIDDKTYWFAKENKTINQQSTKARLDAKRAFLLSIFDEYTIAYNDRSALSEQNHIEKMISMGSALLSVMIYNGKVVGSWKREINKNSVGIKLNPFEKLDKTQYNAFEKEAQEYGKFLGLSARLV